MQAFLISCLVTVSGAPPSNLYPAHPGHRRWHDLKRASVFTSISQAVSGKRAILLNKIKAKKIATGMKGIIVLPILHDRRKIYNILLILRYILEFAC